MKTVSKKLFSLLLVAIMLVSAIPVLAYADDTCTHDSVTPVSPVKATAEADGNIEYYKCDNCDACFRDEAKSEYISSPEELQVHYFVEGEDTATCTAPGTRTDTCKHCDATHTENTSPLGHDWSNKDGKCARTGCDATCEHTTETVTKPAVAATCTTNAKTAEKTCTVCGFITQAQTETPNSALNHDFGTDGICRRSGCGATCTHTWGTVANSAKTATCKDDGKEADRECSICHKVETGATISHTTIAHTYASNTATKCSVCDADRPKVTVTFKVEDPYTHDVKTYTTNKFLMDQTVTSAMLLDAVEDLNIPNAGQIRWLLNGSNFVGTKLTGDVEVVADIQTEKVYLHVWYKLGDTLTKFRDIELDKALYKNTPALNYLIRNVDDDFKALVDTKLGYEWKNEKWYDYYYQDTSLTDQSHLLNSDRSVVAKLTPVSTYKITFEVGTPGGEKATLTKSDSVKNMSGNVMTVTYNKSIGTLPKAKCDGWVFKGWYTEEDGQGTKYENNRTYTVAGDTILYAYWEKQVTVIVRTYVNSNTSTPVKLAMDGYSEGDAITYDQVEERVKQNYKGFDMDGLFDKNSWQQYKDSNSTKKGAQALTVTAGNDGTYSVYVRLHNASTNNSTPDRSNPKTGDSAMIYTAAAVLVLAGCGLAAAAYVTRKKKA